MLDKLTETIYTGKTEQPKDTGQKKKSHEKTITKIIRQLGYGNVGY
jgi:hypothetical protein